MHPASLLLTPRMFYKRSSENACVSCFVVVLVVLSCFHLYDKTRIVKGSIRTEILYEAEHRAKVPCSSENSF